jgi:hypothetical protein
MIFLGKVGEKEAEFLAGYGIKIGPKGQIFFTGEHLQQKPSFGATGQSYTVDQNKAGVKFRYTPDASVIKNIALTANYSQSADVAVGERYRIINNAVLFDQTFIQDNFVGVAQMEAILSGTFNVGEKGEFVVDAGATHLEYNDKSETMTKASGGLQYLHYT